MGHILILILLLLLIIIVLIIVLIIIIIIILILFISNRVYRPTLIVHHTAPIFTRQQVADFFDLIDLPLQYRKPDKVAPSPMLLRVLHTHMISTVPYETLVLHYSPTRRVRLDPQHLFHKIVRDGRGRGGYCLENNLLFLFMLRHLGFQVYPVGVKSRFCINGIP